MSFDPIMRKCSQADPVFDQKSFLQLVQLQLIDEDIRRLAEKFFSDFRTVKTCFTYDMKTSTRHAEKQ
jgi:hypothetical protein